MVNIGYERHGWLGLLVFEKIDELQKYLKVIEFRVIESSKSKFLATGKKPLFNG
jgi:hypothetical protein